MLRPDGVYVQNVIDYPSFRFARAELATLRERFEYVAAIAPPVGLRRTRRGQRGAGRRAPPDRPHTASEPCSRCTVTWCVEGAALDRFIDHAPVITDDFAPIDQWLREDSAP